MKMSYKPFDKDSYEHQVRTGPCFICEMVAGRLNGNYVIYQDDCFIAFLNKYPMLYGYALVAPIDHLEQVTEDFSIESYLELQRAVYWVAEAVRLTVSPERIYILSLGSQQGNSHTHWHIVPLPSGVPYNDQQLAALMVDKGILDLSSEEMSSLTRHIGENMRQVNV